MSVPDHTAGEHALLAAPTFEGKTLQPNTVAQGIGLDLPAPPVEMEANLTAAWAFTGFCLGMFVLVSIWALWMAAARREWIPIALLAGGALCGFGEPLGDILGLTWYPVDTPLIAFTWLGRVIPLYVPLGEAMFIALGGYGVYKMLQLGTPPKRLLGIMAAFALLDAVMEIAAAQSGVYVYYGNNPSLIFGLPAYVIIQNGGMSIVVGWAAYFATRNSPKMALALPFAIPCLYGAYAFGCTWMVYTAINADAPTYISAPLVVVSLVTNFTVPYLLVKFSTRDTSENTHTATHEVDDRKAVVADI
ncbi:hypothetical protein AB0H49_20645 [Nocardia sp. NPDC050713]|uniref:hypothetical protein n=1 Tax=Nocardia sp. NPDC050713 TaxID=3154511 RepID=UPI00341195BF